jgi:RNA polymerase sigma-70 factor (ECF subfamily)
MGKNKPYEENELLLLIATGDELAFRQLYDHYWEKLYSVAFVLTKSVVLSEEIVQDVFVKLWIKREELPSITRFDGYLFIMTRNHIYNTLRKIASAQPLEERPEQESGVAMAPTEQPLLTKELEQLIQLALRHLPNKQRTVFELSRMEGMNQAAIAERMGISKLTVKSHMNRALQFIRNYLNTYRGDLLLLSFFLFSH